MSESEHTLPEITKECASSGFGISRDAAVRIQEQGNSNLFLEELLSSLDSDCNMISVSDVADFVESAELTQDSDGEDEPQSKNNGDMRTVFDRGSGLKAQTINSSASTEGKVYTLGSEPVSGTEAREKWPEMFDTTLCDEITHTISRDDAERDFSITGDITGDSKTTGTVEDFNKLFRNRYKRVSEILENKMPGNIPIEQLTARRGGKDVPFTGIVNRQWTSQNNNAMLELEDTTGSIPIVFTDERMSDILNKVTTDEIVGVLGQLSDDGNIVFGNQIFFPDIPPMRSPNTTNRSVKAVLLSDLHFGGVDFAAKEWKSFVNWISTSDEAKEIEYILIAGDLVEGIGVYPGQEDELGVIDIYDQYVLCAEALKQIPSDIDIITIMGNHDTVRLAEPQPVLKDKFKEPFGDNVTFAGNPSMVNIEGVKFQLYHGMSINPFTDRVPGLDIHEPTGAMELMLEKRHLAPMYGQNVRLAPEPEDYLVIEEVPDVLHTGHVHTFGMNKYNGVMMVNTGCWQYQTDFQRKLNVEPDVGYAPVMNLETFEFDIKKFN